VARFMIGVTEAIIGIGIDVMDRGPEFVAGIV
jgi:hypothetical protein